MFFRQKRELSPPEVTFEEAKGSDVLGIRPFSWGCPMDGFLRYIYIFSNNPSEAYESQKNDFLVSLT